MFLFKIDLFQLLSYCGFVQNRRFKDPLSSSEEKDLLVQMKQGNRLAREKLIEHNLRLVAHIVKKYDIRKLEKEDLISIGSIGLIKAVDTYKIESGHKLTTYAARCIENEILMALRSNSKHFNTLSLNESIQEDTDLSLIDVIAGEEINIIDNFMKEESIAKLMSVFHVLDERERDILIKRYGLFNQKELTQKEIAKSYGISRSYVSRIEKRATIKLCKAYMNASKPHNSKLSFDD